MGVTILRMHLHLCRTSVRREPRAGPGSRAKLPRSCLALEFLPARVLRREPPDGHAPRSQGGLLAGPWFSWRFPSGSALHSPQTHVTSATNPGAIRQLCRCYSLCFTGNMSENTARILVAARENDAEAMTRVWADAVKANDVEALALIDAIDAEVEAGSTLADAIDAIQPEYDDAGAFHDATSADQAAWLRGDLA